MKAIVSPHTRIRRPDLLVAGDDSIVDDFCYISTRVRLGRGAHIAANCTIGGGPKFLFTLGDFSSLAAGVTVWCTTVDYTKDVVAIIPQDIGEITQFRIVGNVTMERYTGVGANSVVLPDNQIPEGTVIGALSFVPPRFPFEPWTVYAGNPIRAVGTRDRASVLTQVAAIEAGIQRRDSRNTSETS